MQALGHHVDACTLEHLYEVFQELEDIIGFHLSESKHHVWVMLGIQAFDSIPLCKNKRKKPQATWKLSRARAISASSSSS